MKKLWILILCLAVSLAGGCFPYQAEPEETDGPIQIEEKFEFDLPEGWELKDKRAPLWLVAEDCNITVMHLGKTMEKEYQMTEGILVTDEAFEGELMEFLTKVFKVPECRYVPDSYEVKQTPSGIDYVNAGITYEAEEEGTRTMLLNVYDFSEESFILILYDLGQKDLAVGQQYSDLLNSTWRKIQ